MYYILGVYRPHSGTLDGFTNELSSMFCEVACVIRHKISIFGDLKVNLLYYTDSQTQMLTNFMRTNFMAPILKHAIRFAPQPNVDTSFLLGHLPRSPQLKKLSFEISLKHA